MTIDLVAEARRWAKQLPDCEATRRLVLIAEVYSTELKNVCDFAERLMKESHETK